MSYEQFIEEAFINPIRSVLMIDDDYPTYDEILRSSQDSYPAISHEKLWRRKPTSLQRVIRKFRERSRPLLVDIHDGANVTTDDETKVALHFHQTDLLILDYELDKSLAGDGSQAIAILRSLMRNNHFNLVIVYTNLDLDTVFDSVRIGMLGPSEFDVTQEDKATAEDLIDDGEASEAGFGERLRKSVDMAQYLHSRLHEDHLRTMAKGEEPFRHFFGLCLDNWNRDARKIVLRYLLKKFEEQQETKLNEETPSDLDWSSSPEIRWVRTASVFVAFSDKSGTDDLLSVLLDSLKNWDPDPSRLFLTKLRASMDEYGVVNQARVLKHRDALALWYENLLSAENSERSSLIAESVSRHSDRLMETILPHVADFAERLVGDESTDDPMAMAGSRFSEDLKNEQTRKQAALFHNAFVCSIPPEGWHLSTGHIFEMNGNTWICLSPACDMVPSQLSKTQVVKLGNRLPFIAVRLRSGRDNVLPDDLNSGRYVFLEIDGAVKSFCFNPHGANSEPDWDLLYAENRGEFVGGDFRFTAIRIEDGRAGITGMPRDAQVVAQLRYEYALNLVHKLGGSFTRIGLGFADGRRR